MVTRFSLPPGPRPSSRPCSQIDMDVHAGTGTWVTSTTSPESFDSFLLRDLGNGALSDELLWPWNNPIEYAPSSLTIQLGPPLLRILFLTLPFPFLPIHREPF